MVTNITIDSEKLAQIMDLKPFKSKKEVVNIALQEYLKILRNQQALTLKGSKIWHGSLDEMRLD